METVYGGECQPGFYCPLASHRPLQCPPGKYCQTAGLSTYTGNCSAGFYCTLEAAVAAPTDGVTGNVCPVGHFCPESSDAPSECPPGTFLDTEQNDEESDCLSCPFGEYCPGPSNALPAGNCTRGYYCPGGQETATPVNYTCPIGHYCSWGAGEPVRCANGTYQDEAGQHYCKTCPSGYFCDNTMGIVVLDNDTTVCPMGSYCPNGTRYRDEFLCPIGTFSNATGLIEESQCTPCLGGFYCPQAGMVTPVDLCQEGYYCRRFANIAAPTLGIDAAICPEGHFCPLGTADPEPCPQGTYNNFTGLEEMLDCIQCPAGQYCSGVGLIEPTGLCREG